jgi:hypothetical protein
MLSLDEQNDGRTFILKLRDAAGGRFFWVEKLRGALARRWYDIYRNSDWPALRAAALEVFQNPVAERVAVVAQRANRCVVISAPCVTVEQLSPAVTRPQHEVRAGDPRGDAE